MNPTILVRLRQMSCVVLLYATAVTITSVAVAGDNNLDHLPLYQPDMSVSGTVRLWGNSIQAGVVKNWMEGFHRANPRVWVEYTPQATSTSIAALYLKQADIGLMGREIWHIETQAFVRTFKHIPLGIRVTTGSYEVRGSTEALAIFVNKDNPLAQLSFKQIDAIFGAEHLRGAAHNFRRWGDVGLTGEWADQPIHIYGYWLDGGEAEFLRQIVMKNSYLWNSDYRQFWNTDVTPDGKVIEDAGRHWTTDTIIDGKIVLETGTKIAAALAKDRYGIALNGTAYQHPRVKALALSVTDDGPFVAPTRETVADRTFPMTRSTYFYIDRTPGEPVNPPVFEFLRYVLSRQGQTDVARAGKVSLPLTVEVVKQELGKLE